ncbi:lasso peptide isopeptide bond-forming cyclase [Oceanobacillus chungangensis]|uniref:asparagine synthase (glutamine-hydrolyzing) n=1 Tax=Oceanobacillus chungangensis TaxID=1229152 RepID=A0A3D8Q0C4_9BACI|nr:lasso peptide isopeptide bond-forming cyclase [Oceanobacillus chungangensis]RDW20415.1 asparagine synthetase B [Oceanobacillus chungangensis]
MSAIAGIYHLNKEPLPVNHGHGIMKVLQKFPADDAQIWQQENIFLGCHAQWITPESVDEQLPYNDHERQLAITADAIIDNRRELFDRLQVDREKRTTMPDSQLILLAYCKWGEEVPKYLIGDFAFMIWDRNEEKLFGARDFSGTRTLYYYENHERFAFCTTIEPLLTLPYIKKRINEKWIAEYLAVSGMIDTENASITPYQSIRQIPPSHSISVNENKVKITRYSTITSGEKLKLNSTDEYVEAFQEVFQEAVTSRLRTYRKVGAQLSGGLDSGAVVGFAAKELQESGKTLDSFSYIPPSDFKDYTPKYLQADERPYIRSTVQHVGGIKDHYFDFEGRNSFTEIDSFLEMMEMPYKFFENSFWLHGVVEKARSEGVGVLLNGDRGNFTISWGSALDYYAQLLKKIKWIYLFRELDSFSHKMGGSRLRTLPLIAKIGFPTINQIISKDKPYQLPLFINPEFAEKSGVFNRIKDSRKSIPLQSIYEYRKEHFKDVFNWNATNTLATKLSLRYGVWKRDPTNDLRVVKFCLSVPENQYVENGMDRALIRNATEKILPDSVRLNQRIHGVQGVDWVHRMVPFWEEFTNELRQMSSDKEFQKYIDTKVINDSISILEEGAKPEYATNPNYKILMRCLIVYRFIKKFD